MNKIIKFILMKISRVIFWITPIEFRSSASRNKTLLVKKLNENLCEETFNHFQKYFKKSLLFSKNQIREYFFQVSE